MRHEELVMVCICDYAGQVRGKGFPGAEREARLRTGMGLAPTNLMITAFGDILETPWGPRGELVMLPDPATETVIPAAPDRPPERFLLADLLELDGRPWGCCPRRWLRAGLEALEQEFGLQLRAAFEHEFHYSGATRRRGDAYALDSLRGLDGFANAVLATLRENGIVPDSFLPEYAPQQFEVTVKPVLGLAAADQAVRLREIVRALARAHGHKATFAPIMAPDAVGNGVHIHFSLQDGEGRPLSHDGDAPAGIGKAAGHFAAGILRRMPALVALTAPSAVSYERLKPNRWSATWNNLGDLDREAGMRICRSPALPGVDAAAAFNLEYRAADAAASPYLALGGLVWAGLQGLRESLPLPEPTVVDPQGMDEAERARRGLVRLPKSLTEALEVLSDDAVMRRAMGEDFMQAYLTHKRSELALAGGLDQEAVCELYAEAY